MVIFMKKQFSNNELKLFELLHGQPLRVGMMVNVCKENQYSSDWDDDCMVLGICFDRDISGGVNVTLDDNGGGSADGWKPSDIQPAKTEFKNAKAAMESMYECRVRCLLQTIKELVAVSNEYKAWVAEASEYSFSQDIAGIDVDWASEIIAKAMGELSKNNAPNVFGNKSMAKVYIEYKNEDLENVESAINRKGLFLSFDNEGDHVVIGENDVSLFGSLVIEILRAGAHILSVKTINK